LVRPSSNRNGIGGKIRKTVNQRRGRQSHEPGGEQIRLTGVLRFSTVWGVGKARNADQWGEGRGGKTITVKNTKDSTPPNISSQPMDRKMRGQRKGGFFSACSKEKGTGQRLGEEREKGGESSWGSERTFIDIT